MEVGNGEEEDREERGEGGLVGGRERGVREGKKFE